MNNIIICNNCGATLASKSIEFNKKKNNIDNSELFKKLNIKTLCCKITLTATPNKSSDD